MNQIKITPLIIGVCTLLVLVMSATYAYFMVGTSYKNYTTTIGAEAEGIGSVAITNANNLNLNVTATDMMVQDGDVTYYATSNGKTTVETAESVGRMVVTGDGMYTCNYTLSLNDNDASMYDTFQSMSEKSIGQLILTVNEKEMDLATSNLFPATVSGTVTGLTSETPKDIYAELKLVNKLNIDQSDLAGKEMDITITVTNFSCEATPIELPIESENLSTEILGGLYRYQGSKDEVDDNYICFGTSNADTYKGNEDKYMYRIIGVTPDGELKVIKKTELTTMQWWTDYETDVPYPNSLVYQGINGSSYLTNTTYMPSGWNDKIENRYWKFGQMNLEDLGTSITSETLINDVSSWTGDKFHNIEGNFKTGIESKIVLMYVHDFYYQRESGTCTIDDMDNLTSSECINGWLNLLNNDSTPTYDGWERMMTYYGYEPAASGIYIAWLAFSTHGRAHFDFLKPDYGVRPVFYLKSGLTITGEGTLDSPYMI